MTGWRTFERYADLVHGSLSTQPHLSGALRTFAEIGVGDGAGVVVDVGCGPGEVTAALHDLGVDVWGVDVSPAMVDLARRDHSEVRCEVGTMTARWSMRWKPAQNAFAITFEGRIVPTST